MCRWSVRVLTEEMSEEWYQRSKEEYDPLIRVRYPDPLKDNGTADQVACPTILYPLLHRRNGKVLSSQKIIRYLYVN